MQVSYLFIVILIPMFLLLVSLFFLDSDEKNSELSNSAFECGFLPQQEARTPFSIPFFSVTIVFLVFDLEVVVIIPLLSSMELIYPIKIVSLMTCICLVLMLGLLVEWYDGALEWYF